MYSITVIVPFSNSENYFLKCLVSLFSQTIENIEYIFVNDGTSDSSAKILYEVLESFPEKKRNTKILINNENKGIAYCRKLGIANSSGKYIAFCDSDDYIEPNMYFELYQMAVKTNADIITSSYFIEARESKVINKSYGTVPMKIFNNLYGKSEIALWDKLFKRELLIENNIFPLEGYNYYEDCFMTVKAIYFAKKIETISTPFYHYVDHSNSSSKKNVAENLRSMKHYIEELEKFFKSQKINTSLYDSLIYRLKFQYKLKLKEYNLINRREWYAIFKESHAHILKFLDIPLLGRFKLYFLINLGIY